MNIEYLNQPFPFSSQIQIDDESFSPSHVIDKLSNHLEEKRLLKLTQLVNYRYFRTPIVIENVYDTGNINAVMRSAESFGFCNLHIVESVRTKVSQRTTQGAEKWIETKTYKSSKSCFSELKKQGFQLIATSLGPKSVSVREIDYSRPSAIIFGNERDGVSQEALELCDHEAIIPTVGLAQSFNISVAAAIFLSRVFEELTLKHGIQSDLSQDEKQILLANYLIRSYSKVRWRPEELKSILNS